MADVKINHLPQATGIQATDLLFIGDPVTGLLKQIPFSAISGFGGASTGGYINSTLANGASLTVAVGTIVTAIQISAPGSPTVRLGSTLNGDDIMADTIITQSGILLSVMIAGSTSVFAKTTGSAISILLK